MAMAQKQAPAFLFAAALLLLAAAAPPAFAQLVPPTALPLLNVGGILSCPGGGGPIPRVNVTLTCAIAGGGSLVVGSATTALNGQVTINPNLPQLLTSLQTTLSNIVGGGLPCVLSNPLNPNVCPLLSAVNGTLVTVLSPIGRIVSGNIVNIPVAFSVSV